MTLVIFCLFIQHETDFTVWSEASKQLLDWLLGTGSGDLCPAQNELLYHYVTPWRQLQLNFKFITKCLQNQLNIANYQILAH